MGAAWENSGTVGIGVGHIGIESGHGAICCPIPTPLQYPMALSQMVPQQVPPGFGLHSDCFTPWLVC